MTEINGDDESAGSPGEAAASHELFRSSQRVPAPTPEEEAALDLAIEMSDVERRAFIAENDATSMATEFPSDLREAVLGDLAQTMAVAADLHLTWQRESEPADLLASARGLRDSAAMLATTIERLWPGHPPVDY